MTHPAPDTNWKIISSSPQRKSAKLLEENREIPAPILTILANRGISEPDDIKRFLGPSLDHLPLPQLLTGLSSAVAILVEARKSRTPVLIYGDYDADGVTATALLVRFFREVNLPVYYHLPDRINEGYGLNLESLTTLRNRSGISEHPAPILLTVDCGITNIIETTQAKALGFRVIITDHHQPGPTLPDAEAIINPHQPGCTFPFRDLAGVGVAFYLAAGLRSKLVSQGVWTKPEQPNLRKLLDLVAIGTIADMVPLRGANRILAKVGLEVINLSPSPGIKAMLEQIRQSPERTTAETVAFQVAPRLNAAGRTGSAEQALLLLITDDEVRAKELAKSLSQANQVRKNLSEAMYQEARIQAEDQLAGGKLVLFVTGKDWHQGITGLVASKLAREFRRPSVVLALSESGIAKGSVRSMGDFDILACLRECSANLDKYGGHRAAAGVTLQSQKIAKFQAKLEETVAVSINLTDLEPRIDIDIIANPGEVMESAIWNYLKMLEPYGKGNHEPLFCCRPEGIRLFEIRKIGSDSLRFKVEGNGNDDGFAGVGFGMSCWESVAGREPLRLAYKITLNHYRGTEQWEIHVEDVKKTS